MPPRTPPPELSPAATDECAGGAPASVVAHYRFYAELNDFIVRERRFAEFAAPCAGDATIKHVIETFGVPHTEVELILINGLSADFAQRVRDGDRIAVYPVFEAFDITPLLRLRARPLRTPRFFADAQLGGLARVLRMAGFDTLFANPIADAEIVRIAGREGRIVLTRDRELLKRRAVTHGCYVHALVPDQQFSEIVARLDLAGRLCAFSRCLECNAPLQAVAKAQVCERLPARVRDRFARFSACSVCRRVFWEGSHWQRMRERLARLLAAAGDAPPTNTAAQGE